MMRTWRSVGFAGILVGAVASVMLLPGCGGGGDTDETTTSPEVEIVPPTDASGKTYSIDDESAVGPE